MIDIQIAAIDKRTSIIETQIKERKKTDKERWDWKKEKDNERHENIMNKVETVIEDIKKLHCVEHAKKITFCNRVCGAVFWVSAIGIPTSVIGVVLNRWVF